VILTPSHTLPPPLPPFPSVDAAAAFALSANLLGAVGKSAATSSSTYTPPALSPLIARLYRFRALAAEKSGSVGAVQPELVHALRLSTLSRAEEVQATLLNLMLRYYLAEKNIDAAAKLAANTTFPEGASNNQLCRNLYYSGRIGALRLEYTEAFSKLTLCLRKAPTNSGLAFRVVVNKLLVVVQCLSGEIPPRDTFFQAGMIKHLKPYLELVTCVRRGDLTTFSTVVDKHSAVFEQDGNASLIGRLRHTVVKAGLRTLSLSYSR
jgi:26S proteasome regulatory subunit N3